MKKYLIRQAITVEAVLLVESEELPDRDGAAVCTVWVGGSEVNDHYLTRGQAETLAAEWRGKGHDDVAVTYAGGGGE